ncbi:MAG: iron ABC transporter permease [Pseudohongiellaceae bacterium]
MTRHYLLLSSLVLLSVAGLILSLNSGSLDLPLVRLLISPQSGTETETQVLWELRMPRALAGFVTGGLLALSGVIMQVLLRNPLADPYILGISGGAAVGALSAILLGVSGLWTSHAALAGALVSIIIVFGLSNTSGNWSAMRLLLTGVVVSAGWGAVINILLTTSSSNNVQSMLFWLMGDLSQSRLSVGHYLVLAAGTGLALFLARSLNVLTRGDLAAQALGVDVGRMRIVLYLTASVLTASAVVIAGSVGFVGLVIPHMLRMLGARDHRLLVPCSVLLGGSFLVIADSAARTVIAPQQLPVGVVTAVIGVPVFILILRHTMRQS